METKEESAPPSIAQQCYSNMNPSFPYLQQIPPTTPSLIYPNPMQLNMMMKLTNQMNQMKYFPQVNPNCFIQPSPFPSFIRPTIPIFPNQMHVHPSMPKQQLQQQQLKKAKNKNKQNVNQPPVPAKHNEDRSLQGNKDNMVTHEENNGITNDFDEDINSPYDINSIQETYVNADDNHINNNYNINNNNNTNTINSTLDVKCNNINSNSINNIKECDNLSSQSHNVSLQNSKEEVVAISSNSNNTTNNVNNSLFTDINSFTDINQLDIPMEPSSSSPLPPHNEPPHNEPSLSFPANPQTKIPITLPSSIHSIKPIGSYYCEFHQMYYITEEAYKKHLKLVHNKPPQSKLKTCTECSKTFKTELSLKAHLETHANQCDICYKLFSNGNILLDHKTQCHPDMFTCKHCKVSFTTSDDLYIHSLLHYNKCTNCNKSFEHKNQLEQHIKDKHYVQCNECLKSFVTTLAMNAHYKDVHVNKDNTAKFICRVCQRKFMSDSALKSHIKAKKHFDNKFVCKEHNKVFISQEALNSHNAVKHKK